MSNRQTQQQPLAERWMLTEVSDVQMRPEMLSWLLASFPSITEGRGSESSFGSIRGVSAASKVK